MLKEKLLNLLKLIPIRNTIIFESSPDLSDSPYYLMKYLIENYKIQEKYKLVWFIRDDSNKVKNLLGVPVTCVNNDSQCRRLMTRMKRLYYNYTAKIIFDSNMYVYKKRQGQIRVYTDHGMPLKEAVEYQSNIGQCDLVSVSGEFFAKIYRKYTDPDTIRIFGLPRDEPLYHCDSRNSAEKKIIWMPTFRQNRNKVHEPDNIFPLGIPVIKTQEELLQINEKLKENHMILMLRLHPAQDTSFLKVSEMSNIVLADNSYLKQSHLMLEDFLKDSDALITDYSSVYYDYLYTARPIGLTLEDVEEYTKTMDLVFADIRSELPGRHIQTASDLMQFIQEVHDGVDLNKTERERFMQRLGAEKLPSCELITDFVKNKIENNSQ